MTDEQIKQNAEAYACPENSCLSDIEKERVMTHFIAGAHSRDEEIGRMNTTIRLYANQIALLRKEIDKLRNPWISVAKMLPEDVGNVGKVVIVLTDMGDIFNSVLFRNKGGRLMWNSDKGLGKPIFWMPIPSLKGGDK